LCEKIQDNKIQENFVIFVSASMTSAFYHATCHTSCRPQAIKKWKPAVKGNKIKSTPT